MLLEENRGTETCVLEVCSWLQWPLPVAEALSHITCVVSNRRYWRERAVAQSTGRGKDRPTWAFRVLTAQISVGALSVFGLRRSQC